MKKRIYTIGYGGRNKDDFTNLLKMNSIKTIVDVRLRPDKASMGIWVKSKNREKGIEKWLSGTGINYVSLIELGNIFLEFTDWRERYSMLLAASGKLVTERLEGIPGQIALMCAEKDPDQCHRKIVTDYLTDKFRMDVHHIV